MSKIVYLTIDDGPTEHFLDKVRYLDKNSIPAVFYCRGDRLQKQQDAVIEAIKKGFIIANHSFSHQQFSQLTFEQGKDEIIKTDKIINYCYQAAGVKWQKKYFRFPNGDKGDASLNPISQKFSKLFRYPYGPGSKAKESVLKTLLKVVDKPTAKQRATKKSHFQKYLRELGYKQPIFNGITYHFYKKLSYDQDVDSYWTFNVLEYKILDIEQLISRMKVTNRTWNGNLASDDSSDIVLMHDWANTTDLFYQVVDYLKSQPFSFELPK